MKWLLPIATLVLANGCATTPSITGVDGPAVRADGTATLGQPTRVGALVVTPLRVVEDSRCPFNARCVWAGRVILEARIDGAGWRETTRLELGKDHPTHGHGLALVGVEPGRAVGTPVPPAAYVFQLAER